MISFLYDLSGSDKFCKFKWMVPMKWVDILGEVFSFTLCVGERERGRKKMSKRDGLQDKDNRRTLFMHIINHL